MKLEKRILAPVIVFVLLLTLLVCSGTPVQAADQQYNDLSDFTYTVSEGEITITGYTGAESEVRIAPSYTINGAVCTVTGIEAAAFEAQETITYVELPATLELVGEYAFYDCLELKTIVVKGKQTVIEVGAFGLYYISRREDGIVEGFVLEGPADSTAEAYAIENGMEFRTLVTGGISSGEMTYGSLLEAVMSVQSDSVLRLDRDLTETLTISKNVVLDLNGHKIDGTITIADGYTLTVKDSTTDDFTAEVYGCINTVGDVQAAEGYVAIAEEEGTSYHRLDLQINSVNLRPGIVGVYYGSNFGGDEAVKAQVEYYGTALSLTGAPTAQEIEADRYYSKHTAFSGDSWVCGETGVAYGTLLKGIWKQTNTLQQNMANAERKIYSVSYVQLMDGTIVLGDCVSMSLREVVEKVDARWDTLDEQQIAGVQAMYEEYEAIMTGWNIPNLKEAFTTEAMIYAPAVTAAPGETITVTVHVKNNPGILGMLLSLDYDESALSLVGTANGDATAELTYVAPSRLLSGCNFLWYGSSVGFVADGTVLSLTFKVSDQAISGSYPLVLNCSSQDTYDANYQPIEMVVANGKITVSDQASAETYVVTFKDYDGTVLKTEQVESGKSATAPVVPERVGYTFVGWDKMFDKVTGNLIVTALYELETGETKFYVSKVTASCGETITVTVNVKNNPGILGMLLSLEYDESVLTLVGTANGAATAELTYVAPSRLLSGCNFLWYGSSANVVTDGTVLTLTFKVANDAASGTYPLVLHCSSQDTYDTKYQPIEAVVSNGTITVGGQTSVVTHTVTFKDYNGTVLKTEQVENGKSATAPVTPERVGYTFVGWDQAFDYVTSNLVVTALYEAESNDTKFYASKVTASGGDTITVTVSVKNNPGILGMLLSLEYDESVLTLVGTANGNATAALTYLEPSRLVSGCNFLWYGSSAGTVIDGSVLTLTFKVAEGAATGTYPIVLDYSSRDTYDTSYSPITAVVTDGAVVIG